jgi:hypothetical protein
MTRVGICSVPVCLRIGIFEQSAMTGGRLMSAFGSGELS